MTVIDSLVVEILGDDSKFQQTVAKSALHLKMLDETGLSGLKGRLQDIKDRMEDSKNQIGDTHASINKLRQSWIDVSVFSAAAVGTYKLIETGINNIADNAERLKQTGLFSDEELERAKNYQSVIQDIKGALSVGASKSTSMALGAGESVSSGIGLTSLGTRLGDWWTKNPDADKAITKGFGTGQQTTGALAREMAGPNADLQQSTIDSSLQQQNFAGKLASSMLDAGRSLARGLGDGLGSLGPLMQQGEDSVYAYQQREWTRQGEADEIRKAREKRDNNNIGTAGLSLGNTAAGYAELRKQMNQQEQLVEETKTQTSVLGDILSVLQVETDPF